MNEINQVLLVLHFVGLAMGLSVSIANGVMGGLMAKSAPEEREVLGRFLPMMGRIGKIGLTVLWLSGAVLVETRWGGFATLPWQFHAKLTAVVLLTLVVIYIHLQEGQLRRGNASAAARIQAAGKVTPLFAVAAVVFAVLTFD